jgi:hypothetical protein
MLKCMCNKAMVTFLVLPNTLKTYILVSLYIQSRETEGASAEHPLHSFSISKAERRKEQKHIICSIIHGDMEETSLTRGEQGCFSA